MPRECDIIGWIDPDYDERAGPVISPAELEARSIPTGGSKRNVILKYLAEHFPGGVPPWTQLSRKQLKADILQANKDLGKTLDEDTLKSAIDAYNASLLDKF